MKNFDIYLAGGMSGLSFQEQNSWREYIKKSLENGDCKYKVNCINPVDYYNFLEDQQYDSEKEVMDFDLHKLTHSDLVIVNYNSPYSLGTMAELSLAHYLRIPVIGLNVFQKELHPWQYEMTNKMFYEINKLINYVNQYYLN